MCVSGARRKEKLGITEKRAREGFAMQVAFEVGLQGPDALKRKDKYFLPENVMSIVQEGKHPILLSNRCKGYYSIA